MGHSYFECVGLRAESLLLEELSDWCVGIRELGDDSVELQLILADDVGVLRR